MSHATGLTFLRKSILLTPLLLAVLAAAPQAFCQGDTEFGIWADYSLGTPHAIGISSGHQVGQLGLRYGHSIYDWKNVSLEYTLDVVPVDVVRQHTYVACTTNPNILPQGFCQTGREDVYGGSLNPIGLKLNFRRTHRLQLYGASTAGFVVYQRPVPFDIPGGTQYNYNFDFQAGFQFLNSSRTRGWMLGYKYRHISNAYRHSFNPGLDLNMIYLGYSFYK